ncbi:hypothetical protein LEMLEM_LOCUS8475, partial [Lemmus lemmus]
KSSKTQVWGCPGLFPRPSLRLSSYALLLLLLPPPPPQLLQLLLFFADFRIKFLW